MKKVSVKSGPKRDANKFAGLKTPKKGTATAKKPEWWRRPVEETPDEVKSS